MFTNLEVRLLQTMEHGFTMPPWGVVTCLGAVLISWFVMARAKHKDWNEE